MQILDRRGAAADHPVSVSCLESHYLKCVVARVHCKRRAETACGHAGITDAGRPPFSWPAACLRRKGGAMRLHRRPGARVAVLVLAVVLAGAPARAGEVDRYLPDDTEIVVNVNIRQILDSPLVKKHALEKLASWSRARIRSRTSSRTWAWTRSRTSTG